MSIHYILNSIITHKKRIIAPAITGTVFLFLILYFIYPITYKSTVTILPPEQKSSPGLSSLLQGASFGDMLMSTGSANAQLYGEILKSRSACEYVVKKLDLYEYLDRNNLQDAAEKLKSEMDIDISKEGIIKLSYRTRTPLFGFFSSSSDSIKKLSAHICNAYAEALDSINKIKLTAKSRKTRIYIGEQIDITKSKLDSVETELYTFQKKHKAVSMTDQLKVSIEAAAKLKGELIANEINLGYLSQNLNTDNTILQSIRKKNAELKEQLSKLESSNNDFMIAFKDAPELGVQLAGIYRESKILNEVYLLLQQQFYKEKVQENRDIPTVEVLDTAIAPTKAESPRVVFATIVGGIIIFLLLSLSVIIDYKKMNKYLNPGKESSK
ncbi:MAG TPA: Wzz/FepE/Etk N-terminal domain-containing protein [Ignavibacteriaceae bacterium]|mgnify:FL=1|nr:Wzz/FepE/Etk N-terminal domain-containing protein [Ignavibacteriaceae bacterium]